MTDKNTICLAVLEAIAEMYANPDKVTGDVLARDAEGNQVSTLNPTATCFCALGFVAKHLGIDTFSTGTVRDALWPVTTSPSAIDSANDEGVRAGDPLRGARKLEEILDANAFTC